MHSLLVGGLECPTTPGLLNSVKMGLILTVELLPGAIGNVLPFLRDPLNVACGHGPTGIFWKIVANHALQRFIHLAGGFLVREGIIADAPVTPLATV